MLRPESVNYVLIARTEMTVRSAMHRAETNARERHPIRWAGFSGGDGREENPTCDVVEDTADAMGGEA